MTKKLLDNHPERHHCGSFRLAKDLLTNYSSLPHLFTLYENLESQAIADNVSITLMGDSAGGNVALVLAIHAAQRHVGHSMPPSMAEAQSPLRNVFVISPATDLRNTNPDIDAAAKKDPLLSKRSTSEVAEGWRGDWLLSDPRVSPNLADLSALALAGVKVDGIIGHSDTLAPDAIVFRKKLDRQGVTGDWLEWEKQMHCFPLMFMYHIFEGVQGVEWIAAVLSKNLSAQDSAKIAL